MISNHWRYEEPTHLRNFYESARGQPFDQRCTECFPIVLTKIQHPVSKCRRFRDVEVCLSGLSKSIACWMQMEVHTLSKLDTNESKYQHKNSSNNSRRFNASDTDTRLWLIMPGGTSQSQWQVLIPWRTWCNVKVSKRRQWINSFTSG